MKRLMSFVLLSLIAGMLSACGETASTNTSPTAPAVTKVPTATHSTESTPTMTQEKAAIKPTSGRPYLGGQVSDFYGKYGKPVGNARSDSTVWYLDGNTSDIGVRYDASSMVVNYITYAGPPGWTKEQYKQFLLTFAPDGTSEDTQTNEQWKSRGGDVYDPIAYTSPSVSKFFLHISDTSGYANIV